MHWVSQTVSSEERNYEGAGCQGSGGKLCFAVAPEMMIGIESVFGSVVAGAFQITFRAKMHANDFFHFLKIIFDISTSKRSKTYKPY